MKNIGGPVVVEQCVVTPRVGSVGVSFKSLGNRAAEKGQTTPKSLATQYYMQADLLVMDVAGFS